MTSKIEWTAEMPRVDSVTRSEFFYAIPEGTCNPILVEVATTEDRRWYLDFYARGVGPLKYPEFMKKFKIVKWLQIPDSDDFQSIYHDLADFNMIKALLRQ